MRCCRAEVGVADLASPATVPMLLLVSGQVVSYASSTFGKSTTGAATTGAARLLDISPLAALAAVAAGVVIFTPEVVTLGSPPCLARVSEPPIEELSCKKAYVNSLLLLVCGACQGADFLDKVLVKTLAALRSLRGKPKGGGAPAADAPTAAVKAMGDADVAAIKKKFEPAPAAPPVPTQGAQGAVGGDGTVADPSASTTVEVFVESFLNVLQGRTPDGK